MKQGFVLRGKTLQVAVNTGMSVRMSHIDGITEAVLVDSQPRYITICNRIDLLTFHITRLYINTTMKVPRTRFAEVTCQSNFVVDGGNVF